MDNKLSYRLSPLAKQDLEKIWLYTLEEWSVEQADMYYHTIIAAIEGLLTRRQIPQPTDILPGIGNSELKAMLFFSKNQITILM